MRKVDEIADKSSCLNRAADTEWLFVLLGRDVATPSTIRFWCTERIVLGKNKPNDNQIVDAMYCADQIERALNNGVS
jgi:hypothetical protein